MRRITIMLDNKETALLMRKEYKIPDNQQIDIKIVTLSNDQRDPIEIRGPFKYIEITYTE